MSDMDKKEENTGLSAGEGAAIGGATVGIGAGAYIMHQKNVSKKIAERAATYRNLLSKEENVVDYLIDELEISGRIVGRLDGTPVGPDFNKGIIVDGKGGRSYENFRVHDIEYRITGGDDYSSRAVFYTSRGDINSNAIVEKKWIEQIMQN